VKFPDRPGAEPALAAPPSSRSPLDPLTYFDQVLAVAHRALDAAGRVEHTYRVAERDLRFSFAGETLETLLTPALAHLAGPHDGSPDLSVIVWDSQSTGVKMPPPPWEPEDHLPRGQIRGFESTRVAIANLPGMDGFNLLDRERRLALYWRSRPNVISYHERSFPFRVILNWWAASHDIQFAHAAAVGYEDGGVLITGKSGAGKSTSALACLGSGLRYASDDHVLLERRLGLYVHSLYNSGKLHLERLADLPRFEPYVRNPDDLDEGKALIFVQQASPDEVSRGFPVRAILIPKITGRAQTRIMPISRAAALAALAPSSMFLLPGDDRRAFQNFARYVRQVPCFSLLPGTDLATIPEAIKTLLAKLK